MSSQVSCQVKSGTNLLCQAKVGRVPQRDKVWRDVDRATEKKRKEKEAHVSRRRRRREYIMRAMKGKSAPERRFCAARPVKPSMLLEW